MMKTIIFLCDMSALLLSTYLPTMFFKNLRLHLENSKQFSVLIGTKGKQMDQCFQQPSMAACSKVFQIVV